jgi:hypothetical protein
MMRLLALLLCLAMLSRSSAQTIASEAASEVDSRPARFRPPSRALKFAQYAPEEQAVALGVGLGVGGAATTASGGNLMVGVLAGTAAAAGSAINTGIALASINALCNGCVVSTVPPPPPAGMSAQPVIHSASPVYVPVPVPVPVWMYNTPSIVPEFQPAVVRPVVHHYIDDDDPHPVHTPAAMVPVPVVHPVQVDHGTSLHVQEVSGGYGYGYHRGGDDVVRPAVGEHGRGHF